MKKSGKKLLMTEIKEFLDEKFLQYNNSGFIASDPIAIPHTYTKLQDIEVSAFFSSLFAWGNRKIIIKKSEELMRLMDNDPYAFVCNASKKDLKSLQNFVHRTINNDDIIQIIQALRRIYNKQDTLEYYFLTEGNALDKIACFRNEFVKGIQNEHTLKHISNPLNGSAAKRLCMFLRWMVRHDKAGVDFGLWKGISASDLIIPLDVHSGNTARKLNLLTRNQNDAKSAVELTNVLKEFDPIDPVKYDYALFGLGIFDKF